MSDYQTVEAIENDLDINGILDEFIHEDHDFVFQIDPVHIFTDNTNDIVIQPPMVGPGIARSNPIIDFCQIMKDGIQDAADEEKKHGALSVLSDVDEILNFVPFRPDIQHYMTNSGPNKKFNY